MPDNFFRQGIQTAITWNGKADEVYLTSAEDQNFNRRRELFPECQIQVPGGSWKCCLLFLPGGYRFLSNAADVDELSERVVRRLTREGKEKNALFGGNWRGLAEMPAASPIQRMQF